jgi:hypothetical protein
MKEAEPVSETLFFKEKHWTMDKVLKQDSLKFTVLVQLNLRNALPKNGS